jgi:hypothetical protein
VPVTQQRLSRSRCTVGTVGTLARSRRLARARRRFAPLRVLMVTRRAHGGLAFGGTGRPLRAGNLERSEVRGWLWSAPSSHRRLGSPIRIPRTRERANARTQKKTREQRRAPSRAPCSRLEHACRLVAAGVRTSATARSAASATRAVLTVGLRPGASSRAPRASFPRRCEVGWSGGDNGR